MILKKGGKMIKKRKLKDSYIPYWLDLCSAEQTRFCGLKYKTEKICLNCPYKSKDLIMKFVELKKDLCLWKITSDDYDFMSEEQQNEIQHDLDVLTKIQEEEL